MEFEYLDFKFQVGFDFCLESQPKYGIKTCQGQHFSFDHKLLLLIIYLSIIKIFNLIKCNYAFKDYFHFYFVQIISNLLSSITDQKLLSKDCLLEFCLPNLSTIAQLVKPWRLKWMSCVQISDWTFFTQSENKNSYDLFTNHNKINKSLGIFRFVFCNQLMEKKSVHILI